ncbi:hypothetical protein D3C84_727100 [compost metagenome]
MRIADPHELAARPGRIQRRQRLNVAELTTVECHIGHPLSTDRLGSERRFAQIQPETLHTLDLRAVHRCFTRRRRVGLVVINPEHTRRVFRKQSLIAERLGENRQPVATALGQGAVGIDDQQIERRRRLKRADQQTVAAMVLAAGRLRARRPGTERLDGRQCPGRAGLRRQTGLFR